MRFEWKPNDWEKSHGMRVIPDHCRASVSHYPVGTHQCGNKAKPGGRWCGVHSDEAIARRRAKRVADDEARQRESRRAIREWEEEQRAIEQHPRLLAAMQRIADGHNDPRALARETLEHCEQEEG